MTFDIERIKRYQAALAAARKAGNPTLEKSILAAMRGEEYDPFKDISMHPEVKEYWDGMWSDWTGPDV